MDPSSHKIRVGVLFGGVAPEHEVSVITAQQAIHALDPERYEPVPVYIAKDGAWFVGEMLADIQTFRDVERIRRKAVPVHAVPGDAHALLLVEQKRAGLFARRPRTYRVDVAFLALHGGSGEDGGVQGFLEMCNVPFTGSGIAGSAIGMDKVLSKYLCRDQNIPMVDFLVLHESEWVDREEAWLDHCERKLGYPVVVKPACLGSSIGIAKVGDRKTLDRAIEDAFRYDRKLVVEHAVRQLKEINCAVLGGEDNAIVSALEQPLHVDSENLLTFRDKYMRGDNGGEAAKRGVRNAKQPEAGRGMASLDRIVPALIDEKIAERIRTLALQVFRLLGCGGVARIDFMIDEADGALYFNEINTIPGSFSFYLWEPAGISFGELVHRMIELAFESHRARNRLIRTYDVNLLSETGLRGIKGSKSGS